MEMFLLHEIKEKDEMNFPPKFLEEHHINDNVAGNEFVKNPEGLFCITCHINHGYPSRELTDTEANDFLCRLKVCPHHDCARVGNTRRHFQVSDECLHKYFTELNKKCNYFQELTSIIPHFDGTPWKLVRESETYKENMTAGLVMAMLTELPEGILEDSKAAFPKLLHKVYRERTGFVKGKYLVLSTENLSRQCRGDEDAFLKTLSQAYALVESRYCSISRLPLESGFWQVCPELGEFVWRNIEFREQFSFLQPFLEGNNVALMNFSLSMGPYYLIGGGYFSFLTNSEHNIVFWYVPNFWQEGFTNIHNSCYSKTKVLWYGWYNCERYGWYSTGHLGGGGGLRRNGFTYNGIENNDCNKDLLGLYTKAWCDRAWNPYI